MPGDQVLGVEGLGHGLAALEAPRPRLVLEADVPGHVRARRPRLAAVGAQSHLRMAAAFDHWLVSFPLREGGEPE